MARFDRDPSRDDRIYDACFEALERIEAIATDDEDEIIWQGSASARREASRIAGQTLAAVGLKAGDAELEQMIALIVADAKGHA